MSDFDSNLGLWALPVAVLGGAIRVGTPYLFVSLGECLTEKSGRVNLGQEGSLVLGAMAGYGVSYRIATAPWLLNLTGSDQAWILTMLAPWLGVLVAGLAGAFMGTLHAVICNLPRVNAVAVGIAMMIFGAGLANYLGKPYIQPSAPQLPAIPCGFWSPYEQVQASLKINVLFLIGVALAPFLYFALKYTRWGMMVRVAGESEEAAAAMGYSVKKIRVIATALGGILAGIGGSYLSLYYPGSWTEQISSGQGLMAVALVIFAKWDPIRCLGAALLFGGVGSLGVALQGQNLTSSSAAYLWNAAPYILTLGIMIVTSSRHHAMAGAPAELGRVR